MKPLVYVWAFFAFIFFSLCIFHYYQSTKLYPAFDPSVEKSTLDSGFMGSNIDEITRKIDKFTHEFNKYIVDYNKSNKMVNILAAIGYFSSFLIAFYSFYVEYRKPN